MEGLKDQLALMAEDLHEALEALRKEDLNCRYCMHANPDAPCDTANCDCSVCNENCPCKTCRDNSNWKWKGARS